jgi:sugar transferase (PEP-CTERM/EpsH1 system associated)
MRILFLAHRIPYPPYTGDKVRAFHIARYLARRHDLTLAFLLDDPADAEGIGVLQREIGQLEFASLWKPWGMVKGLAGLTAGQTVTLSYFASPRLRGRIAGRLHERQFDLIYVSSSAMAQYVEGETAVPVVMDFVDMDSDKWAQYGQRTRPPLAWVYRSEGRRLQRYEARVARWARLCVLVTGAEEALLKSFAPWANTAVVPNGVDLHYFTVNGQRAKEPILIFTGAMDYRPNIDAVTFFCADIFPLVQRELPDARFFIVGLNPAASVLRLAKRPGVVVTGAVPDVRVFCGRASVCVAPLRIARGIQNKVLQAMAMGLPVVATSQACQGIAARGGHDLLVADDPATFAGRVVDLLKDPGARASLGRRARAFVESHHSWEVSLKTLESLLYAAAGSQADSMVGRA